MGGVQLNTFALSKAPSTNGKVQLSIPKAAVPIGNTETVAKTATLFELCTTQASAPLFGMICVETFDKVLASTALPKVRVVANTDAEIQTLNFANISPPH